MNSHKVRGVIYRGPAAAETKSGVSCCNFEIEVAQKRHKKSGTEQDEIVYHILPVRAYGKVAENLLSNRTVGDPIEVTFELRRQLRPGEEEKPLGKGFAQMVATYVQPLLPVSADLVESD